MLTLHINGTLISGIVSLTAEGTVIAAADNNSVVTLAAPNQLSEADWYTDFITKKQAAMTFGGGYPIDPHVPTVGYDFEAGYIGSKSPDSANTTAIRTINGVSPDLAGDFAILPSKSVDVSGNPDNHEITISLPSQHINTGKLYRDINLMTWRLYHCYCSLAGRLQVWSPATQPDGDPAISTMGKYLGTYQNYQAVVSRWNQYAWDSCFTLRVVEAGERISIAIGYTNLECRVIDTVTYSLSVSLNTSDSRDDMVVATELTIYNQGVDSTILPANSKITTEFERNGEVVSGSGYEGNDPKGLTSAGLTTIIEPTSDKVPSFLAEQYHRNIVAIAPCIGIDKEYQIQDGSPKAFHTVKVVGTWVVHGEHYSKELTAKIAVVGYALEEEEEDDTASGGTSGGGFVR